MTAREPPRRRPAPERWLPVLLWMGLIFGLSSMSTLPHPEQGWLDLALSSLAHALLFGVLAALIARALGGRRRAWLAAWLSAMVYALLDEWHQAFVPGRQPDAWDLAADGLGAAAGLWLRALMERRAFRRSPTPKPAWVARVLRRRPGP